MSEITNKTFKSNTKDIKYVNKDFASLKQQLIEFTKKYYPLSYKDFSDSSPGTIFIEQAAYVGDVLSYYLDQQFKESFIQFSEDRKNLINQSRQLGYKPSVTSVSNVKLNIYQLVPAVRDSAVDGEYIPDSKYYLVVKPFTTAVSENGTSFIIEESIDFNENTQSSPREISVFNRDNSGAPLFYLAKKTVFAYSGQLVTKTISVTDQVPFYTIKLNEQNVVKIVSITDSSSTRYYEVDYLAQDTISIEVDNIIINNQTLSTYRSETPKLLKYLRTQNRFITYVDHENHTYIQFGANTENFENEIIIPNPTNVGVGLSNINNLNISIDNTNVLKYKSYGVSPSNTTLTIQYILGGGLDSNVNSNTITTIRGVDIQNDDIFLSDAEIGLFNNIQNSLRVNNDEASTGGAGPETDDQIRHNALLSFSSQNRMVTFDDILLRVYSLPSQFGTIAKAYVESNASRQVSFNQHVPSIIEENGNVTLDMSNISAIERRQFIESTNPFTNNLYILSYDSNKNLKTVNEATILNLKKYLSNYKILTDRINIIDGYIINIGIDFKIKVFNGFNKRDVLNECIDKIKDFFNIDNFNFNQPINLSQLMFQIMNVEGVQSVINIKVKNLTIDDGDYSSISYNIDIATKDNIIYPSKDPSIFEVKYPTRDIKGIVV
jgi:hypothetical protein